MAEWLSRQTRNLIPFGSPGSSPGGVVDPFLANFITRPFLDIIRLILEEKYSGGG